MSIFRIQLENKLEYKRISTLDKNNGKSRVNNCFIFERSERNEKQKNSNHSKSYSKNVI